MAESQRYETTSRETFRHSETDNTGSTSDAERNEEEGYARLRHLVPQLASRPGDLSKTDIVEEAARHIEELHKRVWSTLSTPEDAERAREFLMRRVSEDFYVSANRPVHENDLQLHSSDRPTEDNVQKGKKLAGND